MSNENVVPQSASSAVVEQLNYIAAEKINMNAEFPMSMLEAGYYDPARPVFTVEQVRELLSAAPVVAQQVAGDEQELFMDKLQEAVSQFRKATYEFARGQHPGGHSTMMQRQKEIFDLVRAATQPAAAPADHGFTPMESVASRVYLGRSGGFDVRDCPEPEALAAFIVAACNEYSSRPAAAPDGASLWSWLSNLEDEAHNYSGQQLFTKVRTYLQANGYRAAPSIPAAMGADDLMRSHASIIVTNICAHAKAGHTMTGWLDDACTSAEILQKRLTAPPVAASAPTEARPWHAFGAETVEGTGPFDVVLTNGVTLKNQRDQAIDWTQVRNWRHSAPTEAPPKYIITNAYGSGSSGNNQPAMQMLCGACGTNLSGAPGDRDAALEEAVTICESLIEYPGDDAGVDSALHSAIEQLRARQGAPTETPSVRDAALEEAIAAVGALNCSRDDYPYLQRAMSAIRALQGKPEASCGPMVIDHDRDGKYERCTRCGENWPAGCINACDSSRRQLAKAAAGKPEAPKGGN